CWPNAAPSVAAGPGKLTRALGITREHDGADLLTGPITLHAGRPPARITVTPREGVAYAGAWAAAPLRYLDADSQAVSRPPAGRIGASQTSCGASSNSSCGVKARSRRPATKGST